jgi:sulfatase maturation enzyme AslB (radical SAM superfamily)
MTTYQSPLFNYLENDKSCGKKCIEHAARAVFIYFFPTIVRNIFHSDKYLCLASYTRGVSRGGCKSRSITTKSGNVLTDFGGTPQNQNL